MDVITESTLSESFIYGMFNVDKSMTKRIGEAYKNGLVLDASYIEEQILQIKRTRISPLIDKVLTAFEEGRILLVYSKLIKIPQAVPFVVIKLGGKNKSIIFINNYGSIVENPSVTGGNLLNIQMKDLYVLMEGAYLALSYYDNPTRLVRSLGLMKLTNSIYTSMMLRILNKEYALSMDQELYNQVSFCISRFYMEKVWEAENHDLIFNYACNNIIGVNKQSMMLIDDSYNEKKIETVADMMLFIRSLSPRMDHLTMRYFTECYINTYRAPAILSMDVLPYFLFTVTASYCGSFLVNQPVINDILKNTKGANILYNELAKIL